MTEYFINPTANTSFILSLIYFMFYSISFVLLFFCVEKELKITTNLSLLSNILKYNVIKKKMFTLSILSLIGVPFLALFAPKFASLTIVWKHSNYIFFGYLLITTFISFAIYIQLFDLLFNKKNKSNIIIKILKNKTKEIKTNLNLRLNYQETKKLIILTFGVLSFFLIFKDIFFLITICI